MLSVGIDVAKNKLDLAYSDADRVLTFTNDPDGHQRIVELFKNRRPDIIIVEATGGLERALTAALLDADQQVARVNPANVRHFARALSIQVKTDSADARLLARFGQHAQPRLMEKLSKNQVEIAELVTCRRQLSHSLVQQTNRRRTTVSVFALKTLDKVIALIQKQIQRLDEQIAKIIEDDDEFKKTDTLLQSVPGIGKIVSATLVSQLPELGKTDRRKAPALLGLVPYNNDSGNRNGPRSIRGGRTEPRNQLYMAVLTGMRKNPLIKDLYGRLRQKGKKTKVSLVACMRKLVTLLNAMLRDGLTWSELTQVKNFVPAP